MTRRTSHSRELRLACRKHLRRRRIAYVPDVGAEYTLMTSAELLEDLAERRKEYHKAAKYLRQLIAYAKADERNEARARAKADANNRAQSS